MAVTKTQANKYARNYYKTHAKYRKQKIQDRKDYYHEHQKDQNAYERARYRKNPQYRKYKIAYAKAYAKAHRKKK